MVVAAGGCYSFSQKRAGKAQWYSLWVAAPDLDRRDVTGKILCLKKKCRKKVADRSEPDFKTTFRTTKLNMDPEGGGTVSEPKMIH